MPRVPIHNIWYHKGDTFNDQWFEVEDGDGNPIDLFGAEIEMHIATAPGATPTVTLPNAKWLVTTPPGGSVQNRIQSNADADDLDALVAGDIYVYDLQYKFLLPAVNTHTLIQGRFFVDPQVTNA